MSKQSYFKIYSLVLFDPLIGQSEPGSDGNEGVLCISQSSSITGTSQSNCLASYPGHSLREGVIPLQRSSQCILQSQLTGQAHICILNTTIAYEYACVVVYLSTPKEQRTSCISNSWKRIRMRAVLGCSI